MTGNSSSGGPNPHAASAR